MNHLRAGAAALALALTPAVASAQAPTLTVYTYSSFAGEYGPGAVVKTAFEAECGCVLEWVTTEDAGTLVARLLLEGPSTGADIVLGLDTGLMAAAGTSGLFAPHGLALDGLDLPIEWTDATFVPFDWGWFAFVYDSTTLAAPPQSLEELVRDPNGPMVIIEDPRTSSPGLGLLLWMKNVFGDEAADAWAALAPRIVTVTRGWSEAYGLFLDGEADMVLSYTTSPAYHIIAEDETKYRAAIFAEGHEMQVEVAGIVASTDQPDLARQFLAFMTTDAFQSAIPEGNWMYPAADPAGGLPAVFADLPRPATSFLMPPESVQANRRAWIDEWIAALAR
ncbi:MAG: thiamine ABC transporter substrate binding subunit [Bauldia sp.]|nr:thiamine ABC transporter substrate binding subunit [Bauldia sp.]